MIPRTSKGGGTEPCCSDGETLSVHSTTAGEDGWGKGLEGR